MLADPMHRLDPEVAALRETFALQREAAAREPYPDAATRDRRLAALERLLRENVDAIAGAIARDFGHRSHHETRLLEIFPSLEAVKHARRHLRRWMRPERRGVSLWFQPGRARILAQPLGVAGIVVPWNYPIYLAAGPLVAALAAGNRVMIKMSELVPATGCVARGARREIVCARRSVHRQRRCRRRARVRRAALRSSAVHRFDGRRARGDACRGGEPHAGHARARGQVARDRRAGLPARRGRRADHGREADECRADVHRAGLCAGAGGGCRRLRRGGAPRRRGVLAGSDAFAGLHGDRRRPPLRPVDRVSRRGARAGRGGGDAQPGRGAGCVDATDPADDRARCSRRHPGDAGGDLRTDPAGGAVPGASTRRSPTSTPGRGRSRSITSTATSAGSRAC